MNTIHQITRVSIIGAGNQGPKIACRCAVSGLEVMLHDKYQEILDKALTQIADWLDTLAEEEHITPQEATAARGLVKPAPSLAEALEEADLVIEAVPEDLNLKRLIFTQIDELAPAGALLATNSSSLPCSRIADVVQRPERLFNINFSNPQDPHDQLVELMKGHHTADETLLAGEQFVRSLKMVPIFTLKEIMGFSFNRTWRAVKKEVLHLVDGGYASPEDIDRAWILEFGSPWGPFGLMDIIGLDTVRDIENQYYLDSGDESDRPPRLLDEMIAQGRLGLKTGRGFYAYPGPDFKNPAWLKKQGQWVDDLKARLGKKD